MKNSILNRSIAGVLGASMLVGSSLPVMAADPDFGANISSQTIPVTASIDSYYEIAVPVGTLNGDGKIEMTREHNDKVRYAGDNQGTFYGYTYVGIKGSIGAGKKVEVNMTCADLVGSGNALGVNAEVGMNWLDSTTASKIEDIWTNEASTEKVTFSADWEKGASGLTHDFNAGSIKTSELTKQYAMLHTNLVKDGAYDSDLVINFSLKNA